MSNYQQRKAAGKCVEGGCKRKPEPGRVKCRQHKLKARNKGAAKRREKGVRTLAQYRAASHAKKSGVISSRSREIVKALAQIPRCACGIRHTDCDMPQRRIDMRTSGLGGEQS